MKRLLYIMLLLSAMILRAADNPPAGPRELSWEMQLDQIETPSGDGLRLAAILSDDGNKVALEINIPPRKVKKGEKAPDGAATYRFPLYLQASESDAAMFERLITAHFGANPPASFVRNEEYAGAALQKPCKLGKEGGTIFVSDPTGTPFNWSITITIDPAKRRLTLKASETRY